MPHALTARPLAGLTLIAALAFAVPSAAQTTDADAFMERLLAGIEAGGGEISYGEIESEGDRVALSDVEIAVAPAEPAIIPSMVFEGVSETRQGGFMVELMTIPSLTAHEEDGEIHVADIAISGLEIPADGTSADAVIYDQAQTGAVTVEIGGSEMFSAESTTIDVSRVEDDTAIESVVEASGIVIDPDLAGNAQTVEMIRALGYDELTGSMHVTSTWDEADGTVDVSNLSFMLDDIGIVTAAFEVSGLTDDLMLALEDRESAPEDADGAALMAMLEDVTFSSASLRFLDTGLTERALAYAGTGQGVSSVEMAAALKVMLPLAVARLDNPRLQAEIKAAADSFLTDPDTILIEAKPERPLPIMEIAAAAMMMPQALTELLNISVSAPD